MDAAGYAAAERRGRLFAALSDLAVEHGIADLTTLLGTLAEDHGYPEEGEAIRRLADPMKEHKTR